MSVPIPPRIACPRHESTGVDPLSVRVLRKTPFLDPGDPGATTISDAYGTAVEDLAGGAKVWIDDAQLIDGTVTTQSQLAHAEDRGILSTITFTGIDFLGAPQTAIVKDVHLMAAAYGAWPAEPGYPGDGSVAFVVSYKGKKKLVELALHADEYSSGGAVLDALAVSLQDVLQEDLGIFYTVAALEAACADLRVQVFSYVGSKAYIDEWYAGKVRLRCTYYTTPPDRQAGYRFQVWKGAAPGDAGAVLDYDTGLLRDLLKNVSRFTLPPGTLSGGGRRWIRAHGEDQTNTTNNEAAAEYWGPVSSFDLLSDGAARLAHSPELAVVWLVEIGFRRWFESVVWRKHMTSAVDVWKTTFDRDAEQIPTFYIEDLEVDGKAIGAVQVFTVEDCENTPGSWFWDEVGGNRRPQFTADYVTYPPKTWYVHLPDDKSPACSGLGRALGIAARCILPCSTGEISSGPGDIVPYLPIVKGLPTVTDAVEDFREGRRKTVSSSLTLANVPLKVDPNGRVSQRLFYKLLQLLPPNPGVGGLFHRVPVRMKALTPGMRYADALDVWQGQIGWDPSKLLTQTEVSFQLYGQEFVAKQARIAADKITKERFPYLADGVEGSTIQEAWGAGHQRLKAYLVDIGDSATGRKAKLLAGADISAVTELQHDGATSTDIAWTYDAATNLISFTPTDETSLTTIRGGQWTFNGDGAAIEQYTGSDSATTAAGALARVWIERMHVPEFRVVASAFDTLDDPELDGHPHVLDGTYPDQEAWPVRCVFEQETLVLEALKVLEETRMMHIRFRADGMVDVVERYPSDLDAHSVFLDRYDFDGELVTWCQVDHMCESQLVDWWAYAESTIALAQLPSFAYTTFPRYGIEGTRTVVTYHASEDGARARAAASRIDEPRVMAAGRARGRLLLTPSGTTLCLKMPDAADESGSLEWQLWILKSRTLDPSGGADVLLERVGTLPLEARPT